MKWLTDFLDEEEAACERSRKYENEYGDISDSMYTSGQLQLIEKMRDLIAKHSAPYMSKQDIADELAIMRDEEKRGK